jgi:penicillin amidase
MLAIQRDDRALFFARWHRFLMDEVLTPEALEGHPRRAEFRDAIVTWEGRASVDSTSFRLVRAYRLFLAQELFDALTAELREIDPGYGHLRYPHYEEPLWRLVNERPHQLRDARFASWDEQLAAAVDVTIEALTAGRDDVPLAALTWGGVNTVTVRHPFSGALPGVGRWLDMPSRPVPGAEEMPLAQRADYGASVRFVVAPGREEKGFAHIPMGQSAHPLSPHFADAFDTWTGEAPPTPFLPGPPRETLVLAPPGAEPES